MATHPRQVGCVQHGLLCPLPQGCRGSVLQVVQWALSPTPRHCSSVLHVPDHPLPRGSAVLYFMSSTTQCPDAVWQCSASYPLPPIPK